MLIAPVQRVFLTIPRIKWNKITDKYQMGQKNVEVSNRTKFNTDIYYLNET